MVRPVPDDERPRRRLGDETKERIADLASGWSLDGKDEAPPVPPKPAHTPTPQPKATATPEPTRKKPRTNPPPPPGSAERKALEDKIVELAHTVAAPNAVGAKTSTSANPIVGETRPKPPTAPPPVPLPREPSGPVRREPTKSGPQYKRANYDGPSAPFATEARTPPVIVDQSQIKTTPSNPALPPKLAVPVGEFDSGVQTIEETQRRDPVPPRNEQSTAKRDPAEALLKLREPTMDGELLEDDEDDKPIRGDATAIESSTSKFERGDPTQLGGPDAIPDATEIQSPGMRMRHVTGGTLRPSAALRRKRGLYGDVRYVFTALFGVRASRRELAELEHRQGLRQTSRRRHLVTLGRTAVITDSFDHPALGKSREQLGAIEDERSQHAGAVAASDAELERVRRDREAKAKQYVVDISATDAELAELQKKLEPLEKEATTARRRGQELRESLQRIEKKIAETEALLNSVKGEKMDKAGIHADIATLKADKQAVLRDEPVIASQLDALNPRIAAIEAQRAELKKKRADLEKAETEDHRRTSELLEAIGAKRKVVERAAADAETARDNTLFALGERLYVDRPKTLAAQLAPIDTIDLELGEGDRRAMELKEILSNIDKAKFARGAAMIILALGIAGSFVAWLLYMLL
jgi:prefoldin subunit 5